MSRTGGPPVSDRNTQRGFVFSESPRQFSSGSVAHPVRAAGGVASSRGRGSTAKRSVVDNRPPWNDDVALDHASVVAQTLQQRGGSGARPTVRGRAIQAELDALMEDMYGGQRSVPPPAAARARGRARQAEGGRCARDQSAEREPECTEACGGDDGTVALSLDAGGDRAAAFVEQARRSRYGRFQTSYNGSLPRTWRSTVPRDAEGRCVDASDRNLLCMDVAGDLCVVGSADHGLKVFDITTGREKRNLYTKTAGHTEWVTACKFLGDGRRIVSGGMDSKLCLWHGSAPRCEDLLGHTGSISQVHVNHHDIAISCSYDRSLRIWDCAASTARRAIGTLAGHRQPVMLFSWCGGNLTSGDRGGAIKYWDIERATCTTTAELKRGQVGAIEDCLSESFGPLCAVGDQGGVVSVFDFTRGGAAHRSGAASPVFQKVLHPGGVVSGLRFIPATTLLVTCGADRVVQVLEARMSFKPLYTLTDHQEFIYSLEVLGPLVLSGAGNGWLLVHDTTTGKCLYGLGANTAAVRQIFADPQRIVASGDDGKAMIYEF